MTEPRENSEEPTMGEMARKLMDGSPESTVGLRIAYDEYIGRPGNTWVPFERFELGIQILAEDGE